MREIDLTTERSDSQSRVRTTITRDGEGTTPGRENYLISAYIMATYRWHMVPEGRRPRGLAGPGARCARSALPPPHPAGHRARSLAGDPATPGSLPIVGRGNGSVGRLFGSLPV